MSKAKKQISNKQAAFNGALLTVGAVFLYSLIIMLYAIFRSSYIIFSSMPIGERSGILWANGISIAYSVSIFSIIICLFSSIAGALSGLILKKSLLAFNPTFKSRKAISISIVLSLSLLTAIYSILRLVLKDWMTFGYTESLLFWFVFPAVICLAVGIVGGIAMNKELITLNQKQ
jgi:hypothetical protein